MLAFNPALGVPVMYRQMEAKIDKEDARLDLAMEKIAELERALELRDPQGLDQERSLVPVGGTIVRSAMATRFGRADGARRYAKLTDADGAPLYAEEMECPEGWATDTTAMGITVSKKGPRFGHQTAVFKIGDGRFACYTAQLTVYMEDDPDDDEAETYIEGPFDCDQGLFEGKRASKPGSYGPLHDKDTRLSSKKKICDAFMGATRSWARGNRGRGYSFFFHNCQTFANKFKSLIKATSPKA